MSQAGLVYRVSPPSTPNLDHMLGTMEPEQSLIEMDESQQNYNTFQQVGKLCYRGGRSGVMIAQRISPIHVCQKFQLSLLLFYYYVSCPTNDQ